MSIKYRVDEHKVLEDEKLLYMEFSVVDDVHGR